MKELLLFLAVVAFAGLAFVGLFWLESYGSEIRCTRKWENSGLKFRYERMAGGLIEVRPGVWISKKNYRVEPRGSRDESPNGQRGR